MTEKSQPTPRPIRPNIPKLPRDVQVWRRDIFKCNMCERWFERTDPVRRAVRGCCLTCYNLLWVKVRQGHVTREQLIDSGVWTETVNERFCRMLSKAKERRTIEDDIARRSMRDNPHNDK